MFGQHVQGDASRSAQWSLRKVCPTSQQNCCSCEIYEASCTFKPCWDLLRYRSGLPPSLCLQLVLGGFTGRFWVQFGFSFLQMVSSMTVSRPCHTATKLLQTMTLLPLVLGRGSFFLSLCETCSYGVQMTHVSKEYSHRCSAHVFLETRGFLLTVKLVQSLSDYRDENCRRRRNICWRSMTPRTRDSGGCLQCPPVGDYFLDSGMSDFKLFSDLWKSFIRLRSREFE